ncbi:Type I phosphodiesterase / nucleotide pyrophosphatase [Aquisphaera giovannonii]|uniref:Type I phosphodiesterase / nucleotide pyrophosphatase n=1 Tax=Aquisphaera giovannonii TaxID=406548 RepID=A0A5B9VVT8_9BACT|nr:alkaline phosphatase family protein [Aquisphaera giovannonii]QEH32057.1 Type I phosphodiesterase / nucleotide pyrophosphatase [Aquisphaera giovannonii]
MKVMVLGLDGATWDILGPLMEEGVLPNLAAMRREGPAGVLDSVFPPLSPVAWTGVMTGRNSGKHGVFEFLDYGHDPMDVRVNSSRSIRTELIWETAARHGKKTVAGGVPMSYPPRQGEHFPGFYLGDFLSPENAPDFTTDPALFDELQKVVGPYRAWSTAVHEGGNEAAVLDDLTAFLDQHLKAVEFLARRCEWDLFMFDLMATDRFGHELWHVWDTAHRAARGREEELKALRPKLLEFWRTLDRGVGRVRDALPPDASLLLMSDHGFGPIEWYVNFNVWLLENKFISLQDSFYVRQKHWFYRRGVTPAGVFALMTKLGMANYRVSRFHGKQTNALDRLGESAFLSRRHIDWGRTRAFAQGNFGQIFLNLQGRQPHGCVSRADAPGLRRDIIAGLKEIPHPETGEPLVERVYESEELYDGPHAHLAPDLTVVLRDWKYRTIGLHDFTTNKVISPAFGPTGDHRMEGIFIGSGPAFRPGAAPSGADLLDIAPTVLRLLGVPIPADMDGRVLDEVLDPSATPAAVEAEDAGSHPAEPVAATYGAEDEASIRERLTNLGYL